MDINMVIDIISSLGFPIAVCVIGGYLSVKFVNIYIKAQENDKEKLYIALEKANAINVELNSANTRILEGLERVLAQVEKLSTIEKDIEIIKERIK